jgi:PKHD-type hydroxylase
MIRMAYAVPFWYSKKDRISDEACDEIIRLGKENGLDEAGIYGATGTSQKSNKKLRTSNVSWFEKGHFLETMLQGYTTLANLEAWNFIVTGKEQIQFGEYKTGGFYNWHTDSNLNPSVPFRKLSVTVNLSDPKDYQGGNFEIKNPQGQELKMPLGQLRKRGTVIIFPSFLQHRVTEVKRGTRYSLVQWYNGPEFK